MAALNRTFAYLGNDPSPDLVATVFADDTTPSPAQYLIGRILAMAEDQLARVAHEMGMDFFATHLPPADEEDYPRLFRR